MKNVFLLAIILFVTGGYAQVQREVMPPFNIKTITFMQGDKNVNPIFRLGDVITVEFDDLFGNEANYYYKIIHCDYDWKQSQLMPVEYIDGVDNQRIINYFNSRNTLQSFSHYKLTIPNNFTKRLKVSGNYMLEIYNNDEELVFSRKFIIYEDIVKVPIQVRSARDVRVVNQKHNLDFMVKPGDFLLQNPIKNIKLNIFKNGMINQGIMGVKPMFTLANDLVYRYDKETQFWGGNEYMFFDTKDIRGNIGNVAFVDSQSGDLYKMYLFPNVARSKFPYTYYPDINGSFLIQNIMARENFHTESDYTWMKFSLRSDKYSDRNVYVSGLFSNFAFTDEYKMSYNENDGAYELFLLMKQGIYNYNYVLVDNKGKVDEENAIDGNFFQTENDYYVMVYYRADNDRFDRVIGKGVGSSLDIVK
jgi:hypothetical protein